jgi:hypothetical protein
MHGSLVTSSLIRETTENESANEGYRFGQEEEKHKERHENVFSFWGTFCVAMVKTNHKIFYI